MKLNPQRERLIVRPLQIDARTKSGVYLGTGAAEKEMRIGQVLEAGPGRDLEVGERRTRIGVDTGDLVVYSPVAARYTFQKSLLEQFGLIPKGIVVVEYSEVMFTITPETDAERESVTEMLSAFDESTLDEDRAEDAQLRAEIDTEDRLQIA